MVTAFAPGGDDRQSDAQQDADQRLLRRTPDRATLALSGYDRSATALAPGFTMFVRWIHIILAIFLMTSTVTHTACRPVLGSEGLSDPMVGTEAPPFSLRLLRDGTTVDLATQRGKVVMLDFWAIFCGPCRESMPHVQSFYQRFPTDQLSILSINLDPVEDTRDTEVAAFVERYGYTFDVLMGNGRVGAEFGARRIPRVMLIDRNGRIRRVFQGRTHPALLEASIEELLAEPVTGTN